jgi:hypothetical protein
MLAIMPEECRHRAALLSRLSGVKIACPARESKPKSRPAQIRRLDDQGWMINGRVEITSRNRYGITPNSGEKHGG